MAQLQGVSEAIHKDGSTYYRASITHGNKHISLGSFETATRANAAYLLANSILHDSTYTISSYEDHTPLSFKKWILLLNFRDNGIYFPTPIYLKSSYFIYYLSPQIELKFDRDDLFYYARRTIMKRGNHLFVSDYGMQVNLLNRYGIRSYSVCHRDYEFINNDEYDFRYSNLRIINRYIGVQQVSHYKKICFKTTIHIKSNYVVGYYDSEIEAAIAYNKAIDLLRKNGFQKNYTFNFIDEITSEEYANIYSTLSITKKLPKCFP